MDIIQNFKCTTPVKTGRKTKCYPTGIKNRIEQNNKCDISAGNAVPTIAARWRHCA